MEKGSRGLLAERSELTRNKKSPSSKSLFLPANRRLCSLSVFPLADELPPPPPPPPPLNSAFKAALEARLAAGPPGSTAVFGPTPPPPPFILESSRSSCPPTWFMCGILYKIWSGYNMFRSAGINSLRAVYFLKLISFKFLLLE